MFDGKAFGIEVVTALKAHVDKSLSPILARLDAIEKRIDEPAAVDTDDLQAIKSDIEGLREALGAIPEPAEPPSLPDIPALVSDAVESALSTWERPKDGKSVEAKDLAPMVSEAVEKAVSALPAAKDGVSLAGAIIDRDGKLILTLSDGTTKELGQVVGRDADMSAIERQIAEKVASLPKPKDGADGVGFDDLSVEHDGQRGFTLRFVRGERVKEFTFALPVVLDCGVFKDGHTYQVGDGVTYGGSFWIAQEETGEKPEGGKGWRLAVKRGRDGKDGVLKAEKPVAPLKVG